MSLLALGTVWFWILLLAAWILITIAIEYGYQIRATLVVTIFFVLYFFFGGKEALTGLYNYVTDKPLNTLVWILSYFLLGTGWSVIKWTLYVLRKREIALETLRGDAQRYCRFDPIPVSSPQVSGHKNLIIGWMIYWPFSALWTLINDPVKRAFTWIYYRISNQLQQISDRVFQSVNKEVENIKLDHEKKAKQKRTERLEGKTDDE